jgi:carboxypeptidase C (cathepsin A)
MYLRGRSAARLVLGASALSLTLLAAPLGAQQQLGRAVSPAAPAKGGDEKAAAPAAARATIPLESAKTTRHAVTINGKRVPYTATAGTLPVHDSIGNPIAAVFYVYYERSDVRDKARRPLAISFNGGPGSSSAWMHIGYTGPKRLRIDAEGHPVQPYGVQDNPESILDVADIVFVDPVNVGYSRPVEGAERRHFFGVNQDIDYLGRWIELFVTRQQRWLSPKFLIGESYGTTRVAGLAQRLQAMHKMYLNGVVLVSPTSLGVDQAGPVRQALYLPHYAATAWYHGALAAELQRRDLEQLLPEVERFTLEEYLPALAKGGFLPDAERRQIAERVAHYAGVTPAFVLNHNLAVPISSWRKELLREQALTVGRLDARYQGVDREAAGMSHEYDAALSAWNHAFAPAINDYLRRDLGYETEVPYILIGGAVHPWDRSNDRTGENLRQAMAENPFLKTLVQAGYYDGGTDYFATQYTMWQLDPSGRMRDRFRFRAYRSGHMMYLRDADLATSNQDIRDFIRWATPAEGAPALWGRREAANDGAGR